MYDERIDSVLLARYIIQQAQKKGIYDMSITKLQKLLYAFDGGMLANDINIVNENCKAWQYGPVYPKVFKKINPDDFEKDYSKLEFPEITNSKYKNEIEAMVNAVLDVFGKYTAVQLSSWSHMEGSPWSQTAINQIIPKELIKEYFTRKE